MSSLEEQLIEKIHPEVSPLWAVADSDGLFRNDEVARLLSERGAEILVYDDPMAFRYRYEHQIRDSLESAVPGCHVIVFDPGPDGFSILPADVYGQARRLEVALGDVLPNLSRRVLRELEPSLLSALWEKKGQLPGSACGDRDTADAVLRIGYRIESAFLTTFQDLIHSLIELHFSGRHLPDILSARLAQVAGERYTDSEDLRDLITNPAAFWHFLQGRWEQWLAPDEPGRVRDFADAEFLFDVDRVRVWVDNLFNEGFLVPVPPKITRTPLPRPWCAVGVASDRSGLDLGELADQRGRLAKEIPAASAGYQEWTRFALRYASHAAMVFSEDLPADETRAFWEDLWTPADTEFQSFARYRLESLCNLPPSRPVMVHHIAPFLVRRVRAEKKVALLVLDGLSLAQWKVLRKDLERALPDLLAADDACFSLMPSVTNVCRQSIYAGELPFFFESSIGRTDYDSKRWRTFWDSACNRSVRCGHLNIEGRDTDLAEIRQLIESEAVALGITVRMPDEIVHGATMGWRGIAEQLKLWARGGFLSPAIRALLEAGYELFLTSDHGNVEAIGQGSPSEGVLVDRSGQRTRIYKDRTNFNNTLGSLAGRALACEAQFLPANYLPLLHTGRGAFLPVGQSAVCHGGASLDELLVPFIQLSASTKP